jgi:hypothetical protein
VVLDLDDDAPVERIGVQADFGMRTGELERVIEQVSKGRQQQLPIGFDFK